MKGRQVYMPIPIIKRNIKKIIVLVYIAGGFVFCGNDW